MASSKQEANGAGASRASRIPSSMAATEPRTEKIKITPAQAKRWLAQNTDSNRRLSDRTIEAYAREMKADRWELTHQGIAFNVTGELIDGQHRLSAIVLADVPITMMVTTGLPLEYNSPLDIGYNRTIAHITAHHTRWVSVTRSLWLLENAMPSTTIKYTAGLCEEVGARHAAAIDEVLTVCRNSRATPTGCVAVLAWALPIAHDKIMNLGREINDGELLQKGDPAYALRRWIGVQRYSTREIIMATCAGVKACLMGKQLFKITAGLTSGVEDTEAGREGFSNYTWLVQRRRGMKIMVGTPTVDMVSPR
jgi:hypothetical protein